MTKPAVTYTIKIDHFEGPFDLLLFFIERDELDIYDIPIAQITNDFLGFIHKMESLNIDLASEFILVAATLCRIKAKMLLPRKPLDEEGNEIDPREELIQRLLEYKRYKSVLDDMRQLEQDRAQRNHRGLVSKELRQIANKALVDAELENLSLFRLLKAFERVIYRFDNANPKSVHRIIQYAYTIEEQQLYVRKRITAKKQATFNDLFAQCDNRIHAIVLFLALLEMINLQKVVILQGSGANNFYISEYHLPSQEEE